MKVISYTLLVLLVFIAAAQGQEEDPPLVPEESVPEESVPEASPVLDQIKIREMETLTIAALRTEFPRLSGVFASAHSCKLPDYGPMVSITIQLPAFYFTKPVLQELDRRQRAAEEQARKVRTQLERASNLLTLRSKEANLMERIEWEESSKKKSKELILDLQTELSEVRKSLDTLETAQPGGVLILQDSSVVLNDVDLNKMLASNYQQLIQRVSKSMKNSLAENAPRIIDLNPNERVTLNTYIRDNILGSPGKSILFILHHDDIQAYRDGEIDMDELKDRVVVKDQLRE